jgi:hypothetical protein
MNLDIPPFGHSVRGVRSLYDSKNDHERSIEIEIKMGLTNG